MDAQMQEALLDLAGMDEICQAVKPAGIYRRWYFRAIERGNGEQYAAAAGFGAVSEMTPLNKAEAVLYLAYCDLRRSGMGQFEAHTQATQIAVQNEDWITGTGDYKLVVPYRPRIIQNAG